MFCSGNRPFRLQLGSFIQQGDRESQQDAMGYHLPSKKDMEKGLLAVVADGMGGLQNGGELSSLAAQEVLRHFESTPAAQSPVVELCDLCAQAARKVEAFLAPIGLGTGGTTLAVVLIRDGYLSFLSVGDSRIGLVRGGGLLWLNRLHCYGAQLAESAIRGELPLSEALKDPQRQALTSYLGSDEPLLVDCSQEPIRLLPHDRVLLMTDGVSGTLSRAEIAAAANAPAERAARMLEQGVFAKKKPEQDNFTAIVISCD